MWKSNFIRRVLRVYFKSISCWREGNSEADYRLNKYGISAGPRAHQYRHLARCGEPRRLSPGELEWQLVPHHQAFPCILGIQTLILELWWVIYHHAISLAILSVSMPCFIGASTEKMVDEHAHATTGLNKIYFFFSELSVGIFIVSWLW